MRLSTLAFCGAVLVASNPAVSNASQTVLSNVGTAYSSDVLDGEEKRFLRSRQATNDDTFDDGDKRPEGDGEERGGGANLFAPIKQSTMLSDPIYANKVFQRWKHHGHTVKSLENEIPQSLNAKYEKFLSTWTKSGWEYPHYRPIKDYS